MPRGYNVPGGMMTYDPEAPRPGAGADQEKLELLQQANSQLTSMVTSLMQYIIWLSAGSPMMSRGNQSEELF